MGVCTEMSIRADGGNFKSIPGRMEGTVQWTLTEEHYLVPRTMSQCCRTMRKNRSF